MLVYADTVEKKLASKYFQYVYCVHKRANMVVLLKYVVCLHAGQCNSFIKLFSSPEELYKKIYPKAVTERCCLFNFFYNFKYVNHSLSQTIRKYFFKMVSSQQTPTF
jgi:hypothetical protein